MWNECKDLQEYIVGLRRDLHQIPELGLHLPETAAYVTAELDKIGIPYICSKKDSGIIATIKGGKPGKTICLRADMDALPIKEETGLPFASRHEGFMHACGHGLIRMRSQVRYVLCSRLLRNSPEVRK